VVRQVVSWTSVRPSGASDGATQLALDEIERVTEQYERYVRLARINDLPTPSELEDATPYEAPSTDRPLGLVIDVTTPIGFQLTKRS
jgi:hypothetical protein